MKNPVIRTIYLYLFSLVGLGMLVVGCAMIINLGLKTWVFTKADLQDNSAIRPTSVYWDVDLKRVEEIKACSDKCELTAEQKQQIDEWLTDYQVWQESEKNRDMNFYTQSNRQRQAATALSLIIVGLPLWLFHWTVIKKDVKKGKESE